MKLLTRFALLPVAGLVLAACQGGSPSPAASESSAASASASEAPTGYLARIIEAGEIKVSTDPAYPPQSFLNEDTNELEGFDIDVAKEIADRLGMEAKFETPSFDAVVAGGWSNRWDMSVGSVTITPERQQVLDFTQAYYFTPAQMTVRPDSGITSLDGLAGKSICVAESTTYQFWLEGTLTLPAEAGEIAEPPADVTVVTLPTDINCAEAWRDGRNDFDGWLSSSTTVAGAIATGMPVQEVGDPVFYEPLGAAFDIAIADNDSLVDAVDRIIGEMHDDGTLSELSKHWFCKDGSYPCENPDENGLDLTVQQ